VLNASFNASWAGPVAAGALAVAPIGKTGTLLLVVERGTVSALLVADNPARWMDLAKRLFSEGLR
jgi:hypothetical protein